MKKVLIIGGAGFVGHHLATYLSTRVETVIVMDKCPDWPTLPQRVLQVQADVRNADFFSWCFQRTDVVFHLAANADIAAAATDPTIDFENGTVLTKHVLEAMRRNGVKRLFYMSGSGVYGDHGDRELDERSVCIPISPYGASKLASEAMISAYCHMCGMQGRAFRFANIVGPGQTHGVGYDFIHRLKNNPKTLAILGDGKQSKSYIHVDDAIEALMKIEGYGDRLAPFTAFNVATDDYLTVEEIAFMASWATETRPVFEFSGGDRGWKGDVPVVRFNCGKIRRLGWKPLMTSREAMAKALKSML